MKRGLLACIIICITILSGCSSDKNLELEKKIDALESKVASLTDENKKLKETTYTSTVGVEKSDSAGLEDKSILKNDDNLKIYKGKSLTIDGFAEVKITKTKFSKRVNPSSPGSYYDYYEAKGADQTYLVITSKIKNLHEVAKEANELVTLKIKYDNKYEYDSFTTLESGDGSDFKYSSIYPIDPLSWGTVLFLTEIPKEIESGNKSIVAELTINGDIYNYTIR